MWKKCNWEKGILGTGDMGAGGIWKKGNMEIGRKLEKLR